MNSGDFPAEVVGDVVAMAVRAPSVHNSQPWRWRFTGDALELHADPVRHLAVTDPTQRALLMSCGAALQHARVALAARDLRAEVDYFPVLGDRTHLATLRVTPGRATQADIELAEAVPRRQSDRRRYGSRPVSSARIRRVSRPAGEFGAAARLVPPTLHEPLADATRIAADRHSGDSAYLRELARWSGRHGAADGVPAANTPPPRAGEAIRQRVFTAPELPDLGTGSDGSEWLVLCTLGDDRLAHLRAGEAAGAVLLSATAIGLSSCLQTEPLGMPDLRAAIRTEVLYDCAFPQAMIRLGWVSPTAAPLPPTPRRRIAEVIDQPVRR
ncbi:nitroreductase [Nocardia transvalensis]|uniref:Nitroreductase n=1 Tax=Nocardia transvalensis TaxID=37333 RepID=A0A7W9UJD5_9NOCA|nr:hypothetical protein [Nocardia transvalensis]MBB5915349.1 nitroreductase [Nocardia transvalensis]